MSDLHSMINNAIFNAISETLKPHIQSIVDEELPKMITKKWVREQILWLTERPEDINGLEDYISERIYDIAIKEVDKKLS